MQDATLTAIEYIHNDIRKGMLKRKIYIWSQIAQSESRASFGLALFV